MPKIRNTDDWASAFRKQVRKLGNSWTVRETPKSGRVQIEIRKPSYQTTTLPFKWHEDYAGDAYTRIRNIYSFVQKEGHDLKTAAKIAAGDAPKLVIQHDWEGAKGKFKKQKLEHGDTIKPSTWDKNYEPVISQAIDLLVDGAVSNPEDLMDRCIEEWEPGSRTRQIRSQSLKQFLDHCVAREKFPSAWQITTQLKDHVGKKPANRTKQSGDAIEDQQIINLINSFPETSNANKWADSIRLISELGLRPIELNHLSVRKDKKTGSLYWWCSYQKRGGGGTTEPRKLHPLPLVNDQGEIQNWNLMQRWQANMIPLPNAVDSQYGLRDFLRKIPAWESLKEELKAKDEILKPYSLRHSYSLRGHRRNIDGGSMAAAMGHSYECHCREYAWASQSTTEDAFERAHKELVTA